MRAILSKPLGGSRYRSFRILFFLFYLLFLLGCALALFGMVRPVAVPSQTGFLSLFLPLMAGEGLLLVAALFFGVTVYATVFSALVFVLRGLFCGAVLACLVILTDAASVFLLLLYLLYFAVSASLSAAYFSFCTAVSLRLYTEGLSRHVAAEEKRMFGGTLFCSNLFCRTVNLRFLVSYLAVFCAAMALASVYTALFSFLRSLFF